MRFWYKEAYLNRHTLKAETLKDVPNKSETIIKTTVKTGNPLSGIYTKKISYERYWPMKKLNQQEKCKCCKGHWEEMIGHCVKCPLFPAKKFKPSVVEKLKLVNRHGLEAKKVTSVSQSSSKNEVVEKCKERKLLSKKIWKVIK
mgnify:CR=1 FL=1